MEVSALAKFLDDTGLAHLWSKIKDIFLRKTLVERKTAGPDKLVVVNDAANGATADYTITMDHVPDGYDEAEVEFPVSISGDVYNMTIRRTGKNLLNKEDVVGFGTGSDVEILDTGVRVYSNTTGTWRSTTTDLKNICVNGKTYTLSAHAHINSGVGILAIRRKANNTMKQNLYIRADGDYKLTFTYDDSEEVYLSLFCTDATSADGNVEYTNLQLLCGDVAYDQNYEAYNVQEVTLSTDSVGCQYKGVYDSKTNTVTVTHGIIDGAALDWAGVWESRTNGFIVRGFEDFGLYTPADNDEVIDCINSFGLPCFSYNDLRTNTASNGICYRASTYNGILLVMGDYGPLYSMGQSDWESAHEVIMESVAPNFEIAYQLAEPVVIQLDPVDAIKTVDGTNTFTAYADYGDYVPMTVTYKPAVDGVVDIVNGGTSATDGARGVANLMQDMSNNTEVYLQDRLIKKDSDTGLAQSVSMEDFANSVATYGSYNISTYQEINVIKAQPGSQIHFECELKPTQSGTGEPSPTNVRTISPPGTVKVWRQLNMQNRIDVYYNATDFVSNVVWDDTTSTVSFHAEGTLNQYQNFVRSFQPLNLIKGVQYGFSYDSATATPTCKFAVILSVFKNGSWNRNVNNGGTFTLGDDETAYTSVQTTAASGTTYNSDFVCSGFRVYPVVSMVYDKPAIADNASSTISVPTNVYGGIYNGDTKELTVTKGITVLNGTTTVSSISTSGDYTRFWIYTRSDADFVTDVDPTELLCDTLPYSSEYNTYQSSFGTSSSYPASLWMILPTELVGSSADSIKTYLSANPISIVTPLNTRLVSYVPCEDLYASEHDYYNTVWQEKGTIRIWGEHTKLPTVHYTHPKYQEKDLGLYRVKIDSKGHVAGTSAVTKSDITSLGITDANVTQTAVSTNASYRVLFSRSASDSTLTEGVGKDSSLLYNPSTDTLTVGKSSIANGSSETTLSTDTNQTLTLSSGTTLKLRARENASIMFYNGDTEAGRFNTAGNFNLGGGGTQATHKLFVNGDSGFKNKIAFVAASGNTLTENAYMKYNSTDNSIDFVFGEVV